MTYQIGKDRTPWYARMGIESAIAVCSAATVAPIISIVDKAIVSNASGLEPLVPCIINGFKTMFTRPLYFVQQPAFLLIWGVYGGTYIVGNCTDAYCERDGKSSFYPKFYASSTANVTLSVLKDKAYARMFGKGDPRPLPSMSYLLFAVRDSATIFASFSLPKPASIYAQENFGWTPFFADTFFQLLTPISMQILSCPLHLLGLDLYNRSEVSTAERVSFIQREYVKTVLARMARIFPAFGIGGVINNHARKQSRQFLENYSS